jgi:glycosyltransferase involved in cell wall biosynthesis
MEILPLVTFGFVNCNRLHYLKSCLESFLETTADYPLKQVIVVDNASVEPGTKEYLNSLRDRGIQVIKQPERDPSNEYAKALNLIAESAIGEYVALIPADMQFVVKGGWLEEYVRFFDKYRNSVGCISFDAQRRVRNQMGSYSGLLGEGEMKFLFHFNRNPIMGAANCLFTRETLSALYPWCVENKSHEGGQDSETKMLRKAADLFGPSPIYYAAPVIPVSVAIFNEDGATARIREDKRYGKYIEPTDGVHYYKMHEFAEVVKKYNWRDAPVGIEEIAESIGWKLPLDSSGDWIKAKSNHSICEEL